MKHDPDPTHWLPELCAAAGVAEDAPWDVLYRAMSVLANRTAPVARTWWKWLILIQGLGVLVPLAWFFHPLLDWPPKVAAFAALLSVVIFIGALWWWRWRGRQRTWARARLVVEIARSRLEAAVCPSAIDLPFLQMIPALQPLLVKDDGVTRTEDDWPAWREAWLQKRVDGKKGQLEYFKRERKKAEAQRHRLSQWITLFMDVMLALAVAAAVVTMSHRAPEWLRLLGDRRLESVFGFAGAALPLGIVLLQSLRSLEELGRRTSRFSRQIAMLERQRARLLAAGSPVEAMRVVQVIEWQLLGEVVDWYFEAETAEQYFKIREGKSEERQTVDPVQAGAAAAAFSVLALGGIGLAFLGRVILGRAPWVVGSCALTLCWLAYASPSDPAARARLNMEGTIVDLHGEPWQPAASRAAFGCVIIAHGLHDGVHLAEDDGTANWTVRIATKLDDQLGSSAPNIGLVDWASAAHPADLYHLDPHISYLKFAADISGVRSEAHEVGDALAFRLAQMILDGKIDAARPLYFLGHSAGGFVVGRAAIRLRKMKLIPATTHITILDTPAPDAELLVELPRQCAVDYYVTSGFVHGLNEAVAPAGMHVKHIAPPSNATYLQAHSFAHEWFLGTIGQRDSSEGYSRWGLGGAKASP